MHTLFKFFHYKNIPTILVNKNVQNIYDSTFLIIIEYK